MKKLLFLFLIIISCNDDGADDYSAFEVTHSGRASIVWCYYDDCQKEISASSPWKKSIERIDEPGEEAESLFLSAQILDIGTVTARIYSDNQLKSEETATGDYVYATAFWEY